MLLLLRRCKSGQLSGIFSLERRCYGCNKRKGFLFDGVVSLDNANLTLDDKMSRVDARLAATESILKVEKLLNIIPTNVLREG
jgi:hypothetical protein